MEMETNFVEADSENIPKIDAIMVGIFFQKNPDFFNPKSKKIQASSRDSFGDDAVGYVQLLRESGICTVKCKICPDYKAKPKYYSVTLVVDENIDDIVSCQCHDCAAASGDCMHAAVFLLWVHRRSEENVSSTNIVGYWKEPTLSQVRGLKYITVDQLVKNKVHYESNNRVLLEFLQEAKKRKIKNCALLNYYQISD